MLAPRKGSHLVTVSRKTQVISASTIHSVPKPGKSGTVTYAGGNDAKVSYTGKITDANTIKFTVTVEGFDQTIDLVAKRTT